MKFRKETDSMGQVQRQTGRTWPRHFKTTNGFIFRSQYHNLRRTV